VSIAPNDINVPPCGQTAARPMVTARVSDPDDSTASLTVRLNYYFIDSYQGNVAMMYDAGRGVFTYLLPAVQGKAAAEGGHIGASIVVSDSSGLEPRPSDIAIAVVNTCGPTIGNP